MEENRKAMDLEKIVHEAMEDAANHGLCHEGRIELAVTRVRLHHPDWIVQAALSFVADVIGLR